LRETERSEVSVSLAKMVKRTPPKYRVKPIIIMSRQSKLTDVYPVCVELKRVAKTKTRCPEVFDDGFSAYYIRHFNRFNSTRRYSGLSPLPTKRVKLVAQYWCSSCHPPHYEVK